MEFNDTMITYFRDYCWKNGKPVGKEAVSNDTPDVFCYKIVCDPYFRRFSVECYQGKQWHSLAYDSALLDFRRLNERDQLAWQKEVISSKKDEVICLIRDGEDRVVFFEKHQLKNEIPISCEILSTHGILLARQKMYYTDWGDPFNGVTLADSTGRLVLKKIYAFDKDSFEFTELLEVLHEEFDCVK